jgi:hypothetical protein
LESGKTRVGEGCKGLVVFVISLSMLRKVGTPAIGAAVKLPEQIAVLESNMLVRETHPTFATYFKLT